jgi:integrase
MAAKDLITDSKLRALKPKDKQYNVADGQGLFLRVNPNGKNSWVFNYYHPFSKKRTNLGLGSYPDVSLSKAREKRSDYRKLVAENIDPKTHLKLQFLKDKEQYDATFENVTQKWKDIKIRKDIKANTVEREYRCLELHLFPVIGDMPVNSIKYAPVLDAIKVVEQAGQFETVKRLCRLVNEVIDIAVARELVDTNRFTRITKEFAAQKKQNYPSIGAAELPELMTTLATSSSLVRTRLMIEFQMHTMTRPNETAKAEWSQFDFDDRLWTIQPDKMKMKREHVIPLTDEVLMLLDKIKLLSRNSKYLFPNHRDNNKHASTESANTLLKRNGFKDRLVAHGLRSLASTTLNDNGFDKVIVDACLAHQDKNLTSRAYNRAQYIEQKKKVFSWWSEFIVNASAGNLSMANGKKGLRVVNS